MTYEFEYLACVYAGRLRICGAPVPDISLGYQVLLGLRAFLIGDASGGSLTKSKNRSGPEIDPCGTPLVTVYCLLSHLLMFSVSEVLFYWPGDIVAKANCVQLLYQLVVPDFIKSPNKIKMKYKISFFPLHLRKQVLYHRFIFLSDPFTTRTSS